MEVSALLNDLCNARIVDLSQTLEEHMPHFPTHSMFFHNLWGSYWHGGRSLSYQLVMHEHNGTHVDAPAHFIREARSDLYHTIDQVPLARLMGRGVHLDCRACKETDYVSSQQIMDWESHHGTIAQDDIVLFEFGWSARWGLRPHDQPYVEHWPGVSMEAAEYLISKSVAAIGVDTLSPDPPEALRANPIHPVLLEKRVLIIENLTNLRELPDFFLFLALPLKIRAGSGSPVRAVALV